jgi:hypothetical protein
MWYCGTDWHFYRKFNTQWLHTDSKILLQANHSPIIQYVVHTRVWILFATQAGDLGTCRQAELVFINILWGGTQILTFSCKTDFWAINKLIHPLNVKLQYLERLNVEWLNVERLNVENYPYQMLPNMKKIERQMLPMSKNWMSNLSVEWANTKKSQSS